MMQFLSCLREGFRIAARHKRLVLVLWLAPLLPAVVLAAMVAGNLGPALGPSLFADGVLDGGWFVVWSEFRSSPLDALGPILGNGVAVMVLLGLALQVVLSAGVVEVVLERRERHPFVMGVRSNLFRFARTTLLLTLGTALAAAAASAVARGFFDLAEARADGRLDLVGVAAAGLVFLALWLPQRAAADLSRIAAARHDQRSMTRGYLRALAAVLRRPGLFGPLTASFVLLPVVLHLGYFLLRSPWTPATAAAIALLLVAQQVVMVLRALFRLGFWGAEVAAFQRLGEPQLSRPRPERETAQRAAAVEPAPVESYTI
jgi:hypothetical protein